MVNNSFPPAIRVGSWLFLGGQRAVDSANQIPAEARGKPGLPFHSSAIKLQTDYIFKNTEAILKEAGTNMDNILSINQFVTDWKCIDGYIECRDKFIKSPRPASTAMDINETLTNDAIIEIDLIAMIPEGLKAVKILCTKEIKTNVTLAFSVNQALLAAKAGATYISPFIGRLDDIGHEGMQIVRDTVKIFNNYEFKTEVIVASIRHPLHVIEAAKAGAHVATIPFNVIEKMFKHPLTDIGLERFLKDWEKMKL